MKPALLFVHPAVAAFALLIGFPVSSQAAITRPQVSETAVPFETLDAPTRDGHKALFVVRKPPGKGPFPVMLYLHGTLETRDKQKLVHSLREPTLSRFLAAGYVTAAATFRSRSHDPLTRDALEDCRAVVARLKQMPEVDPKSIVVWGDSGGGSLALELAGETDLAAIAACEPATVLFTGMFNTENLKDGPPYAAMSGMDIMADPQSFYTPKLKAFTREKIARIRCPIFIAHGDKNPINKINNEVFVPELREMKRKLEVIYYPGGGHSLSHAGNPEITLKFFNDCHGFIQPHLLTPPKALAAALIVEAPVAERARRETGARTEATPTEGGRSQSDAARARQLFQKQSSGEKLSAEEEAEMKRIRDSMMKQRAEKKSAPRSNTKREPATGAPPPAAPAIKPDSPAPAKSADATPANNRGRTPLEPKESTGLTPLTDFTPDQTYQGQTGGLYGQGRNAPPAEHLAAAIRAGNAIQPLDANGRPAPNGKIVVISNGPSDTKPEFDMFIETVRGIDAVNPSLVFVNTAQGGQEAGDWAFPERGVAKGKKDPWEVQAAKLAESGAVPAQVQVVWMKQSRRDPATLGEFPLHVRELQHNQADVIRRLKQTFPNLRIVYVSSRTYAGYAINAANPEPHGYEWAWANQWLIRDQIGGAPALNHDPAKGEVKAPVILWGPYLWTDGVKGRKSDSLVYLREDAKPDGMHPSENGCRKVAAQLLQFFQTDASAKPWFLMPG